MTSIDTETKRKLREMGAATLAATLAVQDDALAIGMSFEERVTLIIDEAYATHSHTQIEGLVR